MEIGLRVHQREGPSTAIRSWPYLGEERMNVVVSFRSRDMVINEECTTLIAPPTDDFHLHVRASQPGGRFIRSPRAHSPVNIWSWTIKFGMYNE